MVFFFFFTESQTEGQAKGTIEGFFVCMLLSFFFFNKEVVSTK